MTRKRDYFNEIEEIQSRLLRRKHRWQQVVKRIHPLISACHEIKKLNFTNRKVKKEVFRYIPIAAVSIIEGWFRMAVASLLNNKIICRKNAESLREMKFELRDILHIQTMKGNVGELIAHLLPVNKLGDVVEVLTIIIGEDFKEKFKSVRINPINRPIPVTLGEEVDQIFKAVNRTFELRHVFCHELATSLKFSIREIEECLGWVFLFLVGAEIVVKDVLE